MEHTFLPTKRHWFNYVLRPLFISLLIAATFMLPAIYFQPSALWGGLAVAISGALLLAVVVTMISRVMQLLRSAIYLSDDGIHGTIAGKPLDLMKWSNIVAAWIETDRHGGIMLFLGTDEVTMTVGLHLLDGEALWQSCQAYLDPMALESEAKEKLSTYAAWAERKQKIADILDERPLKVSHNIKGTIMGSIMLCALLGLVAWSIVDGSLYVSLIFLGFAILILPTAFAYGSVEMDREAITSTRMFGRYKIGWQEIRKLEIPSSSSTQLVFLGNDKQLVITGAGGWIGEDQEMLVDMLHIQLEKYEIEVVETRLAAYKWSRNTKAV